MANTMNTLSSYVESVDSNQELTIQCSTIQTLFESTSPIKDQESICGNDLFEDELRRCRGTILDNKTQNIVQLGSFFPYEFTEEEEENCKEKMEKLNQKFEDMDVEYSYEGTIVRIFYHKQWYVSTHRKLDAGRSKWGSNDSFKFLFEEGLKESYNLSLKDLFSLLNLRFQYTFMIMANENTRFVCVSNHLKRVYLVGSNDPEILIPIERLPKPDMTFKNVAEIFQFVKGMKYPFTYQGLLLVHKNGSQYRIIGNEYANMYKVRNNEQSIPYRYLQLKNQNDHDSIELLKKLFPQYISTFQSYEKYVEKLVEIILYEYNKRKNRETVEQIDQKIYLFLKNKLFKQETAVTPEKISELLWLEEPSNLNHMIRMVKYKQKKEEQNLINNLKTLDLLKTPNNPIPNNEEVCWAPKKKRVKFSYVNNVNLTVKKELKF
jgi:hypothetical protein